MVFSQNEVRDVIDVPWSVSKCMGAQYRPNGLWILNNKLHNCKYGIRIASTDGGGQWSVYAIGNVIYDIAVGENLPAISAWESAGIHMHGGTNRFIFNNIINNAPHGINFSGNGGQFIVKNIIIANVSSKTGRHLWVELDKEVAIIDNNLFGGSTSDALIRWGNEDMSVQFFRSSTQNCGSCWSHPITIVENMSLVDKSAAIDRGVADSVYSFYRQTFGVPLNRDFLGQPRFLGNSIDIGPIESVENGTFREPDPPGNLN